MGCWKQQQTTKKNETQSWCGCHFSFLDIYIASRQVSSACLGKRLTSSPSNLNGRRRKVVEPIRNNTTTNRNCTSRPHTPSKKKRSGRLGKQKPQRQLYKTHYSISLLSKRASVRSQTPKQADELTNTHKKKKKHTLTKRLLLDR